MSLKIFEAWALNVSEYLWPVLLMPPPPNPPPPRPPPPPNPPPNPPPPPPPRPPPGGGPPGGGPPPSPPLPPLLCAAAAPIFGPTPKERLTRRFTATAAGPFPRFIGMSVSPGWGTVSSAPKVVWTTSAGFDVALAKEGRALKKLSPVRSLAVVTLNGLPA